MTLGDTPDTIEEWMRAKNKREALADRRPAVHAEWVTIQRLTLSGALDTVIDLPNAWGHRITIKGSVASAALTEMVYHQAGGADIGTGYDLQTYVSVTGSTDNGPAMSPNLTGVAVIAASSSRLIRSILDIDGASLPEETYCGLDFAGGVNPGVAASTVHAVRSYTQRLQVAMDQVHIAWGQISNPGPGVAFTGRIAVEARALF